MWERAAAALQVGEIGGIFGGRYFYGGQMWLLVVDAVKPGALPLDPAPAESPGLRGWLSPLGCLLLSSMKRAEKVAFVGPVGR